MYLLILELLFPSTVYSKKTFLKSVPKSRREEMKKRTTRGLVPEGLVSSKDYLY